MLLQTSTDQTRMLTLLHSIMSVNEFRRRLLLTIVWRNANIYVCVHVHFEHSAGISHYCCNCACSLAF